MVNDPGVFLCSGFFYLKRVYYICKIKSMKNLFETDYVIYNKSTDWVAKYSESGDIVIYGDLDAALEDCKYEGEEAVKCTDLPEHHKELLIKQIQTT